MLVLCFLVCIVLCGSSIINAQNSSCEEKTEVVGVIKDAYSNNSDYEKCWKIQVPTGSYVRIQFKRLYFSAQSCSRGYVKINSTGTGEINTFCSVNDLCPIISFSPLTITYRVQNSGRSFPSNFELFYNIENTICAQPKSFRCSDHICIPRFKVCDGVKDCENGADEAKCGVLSIEGVSESRRNAISWLKSKRTKSWGWRKNTFRAIIALYLADGADFNETGRGEELMAKQLEIEVSAALMQYGTVPLSPNQFSMIVNSLLTICLNPRNFYGYNFVNLLDVYLRTHPIPVIYLALCNANVSLPENTIPVLQKVLTTRSEYPFFIEFQAMAVMALSCMRDRNMELHHEGNISIMHHYNATIKHFKSLQHQDGSFGNVYTTALITQALLSSGQENSKDWKLNTTIKYLMAKLNSPSVDFLTVYLTLPILNGKSLADIGKRNCSGNSRKNREEQVADENKLGGKWQVQYSLYLGDEKDLIYTISLRVPENVTALEVMKKAAAVNPKYKFKTKQISGKLYVYDIAGIPNDSEAGNFWLLYTSAINNSTATVHYTEGPEEVTLNDKEHLIMWYKTVHSNTLH